LSADSSRSKPRARVYSHVGVAGGGFVDLRVVDDEEDLFG
jgi:hypothetical protein